MIYQVKLDSDGVGGGEGGGDGGAAVVLASGAITDLQVVTRTSAHSCTYTQTESASLAGPALQITIFFCNG